MALTGKTNEEKIWNHLKAAGLTDHGTAGRLRPAVFQQVCKRHRNGKRRKWND